MTLDEMRAYWNWRGLHLTVTEAKFVIHNKLERYEASGDIAEAHEQLKRAYKA
jgi:hypothetical protein